MGSVKTILLAGAAVLASSMAEAADLPPVMPAPMYQPPPVEVFAGWYLRGDIGMTNQRLNDIHNVQMDTAVGLVWFDKGGFDSGMLWGLGAGYQFNWFRIDVTGEYRGKVNFHALDSHAAGTNDYTATKSEWLFLANAYFELGTWWCLSPFVGFGIGTSRVQIDHYRDNNIIAGGGGWADGADTWNFAWAAHAGLAYKVNPNFTVELAYRYVDLGKGKTGDTINLDGTNPILGNSTFFNGLSSHDLKLGVRWMLQPEPVRPMPVPLIRKG
jgi:opacity protein-like surface antigen